MKKLFLSLIILSMALPYLNAQSACEEVSKATITLTRRGLTPEEQSQECSTTFESEISFYHVSPGCLPGIFTVGQNTTTGKNIYVRFSKGNLQYLPASANGDSVWRFAPHQYDYVGANNTHAGAARNHEKFAVGEEKLPPDEIWYDLFGYGTSGADPYDGSHPNTHPLTTSTEYGKYCHVNLTGTYSNYDWGMYNKIFMGGDQPGLWRTLTASQWSYLINTRMAPDGVSKLYCHGRIKIKDDSETYVNGVFVFPDGFTDIDNPAAPGSTLQTKRGTCAYADNTFTLTQWDALEKVGVVFLPAAGYRDGTAIGDVNSIGYYWHSTHNGGDYYIYPFRIYGKGIGVGGGWVYQYRGCSVRLVQDFTK